MIGYSALHDSYGDLENHYQSLEVLNLYFMSNNHTTIRFPLYV